MTIKTLKTDIMKTARTVFTLLALLVCFGVSSLNAQENLWKWIEKYKKDKSVDVTIITNNNSETKKIEKEIYTIKIADSPQIVKELLDACNKDKQDAYSHTERRPKGVSVSRPYYCRFKNNETDESFSFSFDGENSVVLSVIKTYLANITNRGFDFHSFNFYNPLDDPSFMQSIEHAKQSILNNFSDSSFMQSMQFTFPKGGFYYKDDDGEYKELNVEEQDSPIE